MNKVKLTCSLVIFNENTLVLDKIINSFLSIPLSKIMYIIDNSTKSSHFIKKRQEIKYIKNDKNLGFGKAHNQIIERIRYKSDYHLILNPDVEFEGAILKKLISVLKANKNIILIAPRAVDNNGELQYTCRKHPTIKELLSRRLGINSEYVKNREYRNLDLTKPFMPEFIYGCFMLFKTNKFVGLSGFDTRYFLYLEDADLCRKIYQNKKRILYFPEVQIKHIHRKGSSKQIKLFLIHLLSAYKYFKKWT